MDARQAERLVIAPYKGRVIVRAGDEIIADSRNALALDERGHERMFYLPAADVQMDLLEPTSHSSVCPYKGTARYWSIRANGRRIDNAAWAYDKPIPGAAPIARHIAFYPDHVDAIEVQGA